MKQTRSAKHNSWHATRTLTAMLAVIVLCSLHFRGLRAQSNSEYSFRQQMVDNADRYSADDDDAPNLSMDCLAANGYGQWTLSSTGGAGPDGTATQYKPGWYLLANGLYKPSIKYDASNTTLYPGCFPPGIVQNAHLTFPAGPKATADLDQWSCFVWPDGTGANFDMQEFGPADIDISLNFLNNPTPPMNIISSSAPHSQSVSAGGHIVLSSGDTRDRFDACSDAAFLYIVWTSYNGTNDEVWVTVVPLGSSTAVAGYPKKVDNGQLPTIACDARNNRGGGSTPAFKIAYIDNAGTVVKTTDETLALTTLSQHFWNPNVASPGSTIAYNTALHARIVESSVYGGTSTFAVYAIVDGNDPAVHHFGDALIFYPPSTSIANFVAGTLMLPPSPITTGGLGVPVVNQYITAFANPYDNQSGWHASDEFHCLYQYDLGSGLSPEFPLLIVRGSDVAALMGPSPDPANHDTRLVLNQTSGGTLEEDPADNFYVGAVNQMGIHVHWHATDDATSSTAHYYARDTGRSFDEVIDENTLVTDICTVRNGTSHGGTGGATVLPNITMAIWTDPNYGFSLTDPNSGLYQPRTYGSLTTPALIDNHVGMLNFRDENVILSIGDGSNLVHGTPANLTNVPYFYFNFLGENRGSTQGVVVHGTWNYYGLVAVHDPTTQAATLNASPFTNGSLQCDACGTNIAVYPQESGGGFIQIGNYWQDVEDAGVDMPATLIVHAGANFFCGEWTSFSITPDDNGISGNVDVLYEPSVFPILNSTYWIDESPSPDFLNCDTTGMLTLDGKTVLQRSSAATSVTASTWSSGGNIRGHIPLQYSKWWDTGDELYTANNVILFVDKAWDQSDHSSDLTHTKFEAENFTFYNVGSPHNGTAELRFGKPDPGASDFDAGDAANVIFNGGLADDIEIHMIDPDEESGYGYSPPVIDYTIENMTFNDLRSYTILIESDQEPYYEIPYGLITVANNTFKSFDPNVGTPLLGPGVPEAVPVYGIYVRNFNYEGYWDGNIGEIDITGNEFTTANCSNTVDDEDISPDNAAIALENTTANVESNTITDLGFTDGINIISFAIGGSPIINTLSLICSNTIENLISGCNSHDVILRSGINSSYGAGYVKLNTIADNDIGYNAYETDKPKLVFNSIGDNTVGDNIHYGIEVGDNSTVDMTGVHSATSGGDDIAAINTVRGPSSDINSVPPDPILIFVQGPSADVLLGKQVSWWTNWGLNNLFVTSSGSPAPIIGSLISLSLGNIDNNFWGTGVDPSMYGSSGCSNCIWNSGTTVNAQASGSHTLTYAASSIHSQSSFSDVTCGTGWGQIADLKSGKEKTQNTLDDSSTACHDRYWTGYEYANNSQWLLAYDTLTKFIETCPHDPNAPGAFVTIATADAHLGQDDETRAKFLSWLESVLYLNTTDPEYFCQCVREISGTLPLPHDTSAGATSRGTNITLAVWQWLLQNTTCDTPHLWKDYEGSRLTQLQQWQNDPTAYKLDTTLKPLDSLSPGLLELLEKHFLYADVPDNFTGIISNASAYPNPTGDGTVLSFGISKEAYVKIDLFDVLGHELSQPGFESLFEPGNKSVPISLASLAPGTYYARIVSAYGEVQTVKLVKE